MLRIYKSLLEAVLQITQRLTEHGKLPEQKSWPSLLPPLGKLAQHTYTHTWDRLAFPGEGKQTIAPRLIVLHHESQHSLIEGLSLSSSSLFLSVEVSPFRLLFILFPHCWLSLSLLILYLARYHTLINSFHLYANTVSYLVLPLPLITE